MNKCKLIIYVKDYKGEEKRRGEEVGGKDGRRNTTLKKEKERESKEKEKRGAKKKGDRGRRRN